MTIFKKFLDKACFFRYNTHMKNYFKQPWTDNERRVLAQNYLFRTAEEIQELLPNRTLQSIRNQVHYLRKRGYRFKQ